LLLADCDVLLPLVQVLVFDFFLLSSYEFGLPCLLHRALVVLRLDVDLLEEVFEFDPVPIVDLDSAIFELEDDLHHFLHVPEEAVDGYDDDQGNDDDAEDLECAEVVLIVHDIL
jgi:hypothetical protein